MNIVSIRFCIIAGSIAVCGYLLCIEPNAPAAEESFNGKLGQISNLTINIECNPQQIIKDVKQDLLLMFNKLPEFPARKYSSILGAKLYDLKYHIGGSAALGIYLFLLYEVVQGNACLGSTTSWSVWKPEFPLNEFLALPAATLSHDLLLEIQRKYTSAAAPADFVSSLIAFMKDIDQEISSVKYYNNLVTWLKRLRISILFPIKHKLFALSAEHLSRLSYIRNIFLNWAAQYKMDKNKRYMIEGRTL